MNDQKSFSDFRKNLSFLCLLICFLIAAMSFAYAQNEVNEKGHEEQTRHWADRIHTGGERNDFAGTFVVASSQEISSLRTVQAYMDNKTYELVVRLDGPPLEVYKVGSELYTVYPTDKFVLLEQSALTQVFPVLLRFDHRGLENFYEIQSVGTERIADRQTDIIDIQPRDQWRFRFKVWLDQSSGVLLKGQVFDQSGLLLIQITFSDVQIGLQSGDLQKLKDYAETLRQQGYQFQELDTDSTDIADKGPWLSVEPVPGFKPIHHVQKSMPGKLSEFDQWVFTDGMVSVSVFIEPIGDGDRVQKEPIQSVDGTIHSLSILKNQHRVTLVGEVPFETLQEFAKQLDIAISK